MHPVTHAITATAVLCCATVAYTYRTPDFGRFLLGIDDFLPRYTQARLLGSDQMYDIEAGYREQDRTAGVHVVGAYHDRLPWQALLMAPLGRLPYLTAHWIWTGLSLLAFGALVSIWLVPRDSVLWGAVFFPAGASIVLGQDGLMLTVCLAAAMRCVERRQEVAAGLFLALCGAKPHLFFLLPVALIAHRRWRIVKSATAGTAVLLIAGTASSGVDWPLRWWNVLKVLGRETDRGHNLAQCPSVFNFGINAATITVALAVGIGVTVLIWRTGTLEAAVALAVLGGILIAPHAAIYDLPLLLVALPMLPFDDWKRWIRITLLTPVPYWALLKGPPWSAVLPVMLLTAAIASACPTADRRTFAATIGQ